MTELRNSLEGNENFRADNDDLFSTYLHTVGISEKLGLVLNEFYLFKKQDGELDSERLSVEFRSELCDETLSPRNHEKLPVIAQAAKSIFAKFGEVDTNNLEHDGIIDIKADSRFISCEPDFINAAYRYAVLLFDTFEVA